MVKNSVLGKLRIRKLNIKRVVALNVVPEHRTSRFRPGNHFCDFFPPFGTVKRVLVLCRCDNCPCALAERRLSIHTGFYAPFDYVAIATCERRNQ